MTMTVVLSGLIIAPFVVAIIAGLALSRAPRFVQTGLVALVPATTLVLGIASLLTRGAAEGRWGGHTAYAGSVPWFSAGDVTLDLVWAVDGLAGAMLVAVGLVGTCVVLYSHGYLDDEAGYPRYLALVSAFVGSMNLLVIAQSLVVLFIGWELVGACSYLLIGFWFDRVSAAEASRKAFLTTRVGDVAIILGSLMLFAESGTLDYEGLYAWAGSGSAALTAGVVLVAVGAMAKSAQFPFHSWLPDAMEGPTPASALIHAATMVAAGVYLVVRLWPLFAHAELARDILLITGTISAAGAAVCAIFQTDLKKTLAYSTISQLGLMFAALGAGVWWAALFHLLTHAAFKALLFLGAGSVIHGAHAQDLASLGGLRKRMPITFAIWMVGSLALAGVYPLAGFFSKDAVFEGVLHHAPVAAYVLFFGGFVTAVYVARVTRLTFFGPTSGHAHESRAVMAIPLVVLAIPSAVAGFMGGPVAHAVGAEAEPLALTVSLTASSLAAAGLVLGWWLTPAIDAVTSHPVPRWIRSGFAWDKAVAKLLIQPALLVSRGGWALVDRLVFDGIPVALSAVTSHVGRLLRSLHSGDVQRYATTVVAAIAVLLVLVYVMVG